MLKAIEYEILRNVEANGRIKIPLQRQPVRVATLLDEEEFLKDKLMRHNRTVFLEDRTHDWDWRNGNFTYYTRIAMQADVLIAYEVEKISPNAAFDTATGQPVTDNNR